MFGVYFKIHLHFFLIFMSLPLPSLCYKVAYLVAYSLLQSLVCLVLFQVTSVTCNEFVKEKLF